MWKCHALKLILIDLLSSVVLKPLINILSDPDNINRTIIRSVSVIKILFFLTNYIDLVLSLNIKAN